MIRKFVFIFLLVGVTLSLPAGTLAQFAVEWLTIDAGGGPSSGGTYTLTGTIGQFDATTQSSTGAGYSVRGGFWVRIADLLFKDGFEDPN